MVTCETSKQSDFLIALKSLSSILMSSSLTIRTFKSCEQRLISAVTMSFHSYEVGEAVTYVQAASLCVMAKGHCGCLFATLKLPGHQSDAW